MKRLIFFVTLLVALSGCDDVATDPLVGSIFLIEVVPGESFRVLLSDAEVIAEARLLLESGETTVVHGKLVTGNGGFNAGYSWHLSPATVSFVDIAMELCDGRPSYVEEELSYYLESVEYYCPWGITVVAEEG
jgi:hypothetical protein